MYNSYFGQSYNIERINNQIKELESLRNSYQQMTQPPMNVFNVGAGQSVDFEARFLKENEKPGDILIQRKTAFIDLYNGKLIIKQVNGDLSEYTIILPKDPKDLKIEALEAEIAELKKGMTENEQSNNNVDEQTTDTTKDK